VSPCHDHHLRRTPPHLLLKLHRTRCSLGQVLQPANLKNDELHGLKVELDLRSANEMLESSLCTPVLNGDDGGD